MDTYAGVYWSIVFVIYGVAVFGIRKLPRGPNGWRIAYYTVTLNRLEMYLELPEYMLETAIFCAFISLFFACLSGYTTIYHAKAWYVALHSTADMQPYVETLMNGLYLQSILWALTNASTTFILIYLMFVNPGPRSRRIREKLKALPESPK